MCTWSATVLARFGLQPNSNSSKSTECLAKQLQRNRAPALAARVHSSNAATTTTGPMTVYHHYHQLQMHFHMLARRKYTEC